MGKSLAYLRVTTSSKRGNEEMSERHKMMSER